MTRVIGGGARGRRLKVPRGQSLRPTASRVKEALFNILPHDLSGQRVLDLFAGTGGLSMEALSRGAERSLLVDSSRRAEKVIRENLRNLKVEEKCRVWVAPVQRSVRNLARKKEKFDLIFLDPPYEKGWVDRVLKTIAEGELLQSGGRIIAEHSIREKVEKNYGPLVLLDQRRYGTTLLSFFGRGRARAT